MQTIYYQGAVVTMTGERATALVTEDGRIAAVGEERALLAQYKEARRVSLTGGALLPGFVDAHSHFSQVAAGFTQVSLAGVSSVEEMTRRLRDYGLSHPKQKWITARDYDNNLLPGYGHPTRAQLDDMTDGRPLSLQHQSGHMGLFNTAALEALGITAATADPAGGRIGREGGVLTGLLEENAFFDAQKKVPLPGPDTLLEAYRQAQRLYASYGITTVQEGMLTKEMLPMYDLLLSSGLLRLDLVAYPDRSAFAQAWDTYPQRRYEHHFRLGGLKIFLDGSPQVRTAWLRRPYEGSEDRGYGTMTDEAVKEAMETAAEHRVQLLAHCNGDAAAAQFLTCLASAEEEWPQLRELRPVMIHAQLLGLDQIETARDLGAVASFFVAHTYHWGDVHLRNLGEERASRISPAASALKAGLPFTFHQDAPVIQPDMLETVWCAVNRRTKAGRALMPEERLPVEEALRAVTRYAAWQYGEEGDKGTLSPGKRANLVILGKDPRTADPEELRDIPVLATVKDGETVYTRE